MRCRSCDAPMVFRRTAEGKAMPLDPTPNPLGNVVLTRDGGCRVLSGEELAEHRRRGKTLYLPHFVSCPNADEWRARGEAG